MAVESFTGRKRVRKSFGRIPTVVPMPNLIEVQKTSYEGFLQREINSEEREKAGKIHLFYITHLSQNRRV